MAFRASPSPFGVTAGTSSSSPIQQGPELEEISTEALGFQAIAGETKLQLLPSPWPIDSLPPPTASLLSVAPKKGLLAAAGPESVIVAGTESVRQGFSAESVADGTTKPFTPQLTLNVGMRVSQVAFSADESFLVLSAENGGGLAVYDVQSLMQGSTESAFQLTTNGTALRALLPNPTPERAELFAAVSTNGQLLMANLKSREFFSGPQGQLLKDGVSCVSWSARGKQLIAGLGNGTCYQMTPEGEGKAELSRPPGLDGDQHVSSISWLENDVFLIAHTPSSSDGGMIPETTYHLVTRQTKPQTSMVFQKLPDPCPPFGLHRSPAFQFMQRLRDYPPNLQDIIVVASTTSIDIGLVTRSKTPLTNDAPAEKVTSVFTTTAMADDSRRAQMPMSKDQTDTSPIGVCFDLSSKDKVLRPLPKEEFDASQGPLPALMILNNEGVLSSWWIVYAESIRQGTVYPGLVAAGGPQTKQQPQTQRQASPFASAGTQAAPAFGPSTSGKPSTPAVGFGSAFSKPATSAFGMTSSPISGFGASKSQSPFGAPTVTPTTSQSGGSTFGQPSFGSSTPMGSVMGGTGRGPNPTGAAAFGTAGGFGNRGSVWGTPSSGTAAASGSVFGQSGFSGAHQSAFGAPSTGNAFGSNTPAIAAAPNSGGFASFAAKTGGFMTAAPPSAAQSPFGKSAQGASFGSGMGTDTSFGATSKKDAEAPKSIFGGGGAAFTLGTTFKGDGPPANEAPKPEGNESKSMFGDGFRSALGDAQKEAATPHTKDAEMDEDDSAPAQSAQPDPVHSSTTTPVAKPTPPKFQFPSVPPSTGGLFGTQAQGKTTPAAVHSSQPSSFTFGKPTPITTTPNDTPKKPEQPIRPSVEISPKIKEEPHSDDDNISPLNEEEAAPPLGFGTPKTPSPTGTKSLEDPVPPESTSKTSFAPGDSSTSSKSSEEAPLPPDFLPSKTKLKEVEPPPDAQAALPENEDEGEEEDADAEGDEDEEEGLDDEGSGVDVAQEISPSTDPTQSPKITPGSSFGGPLDKSPLGGLFSRVSQPQGGQAGRSLFGEIGKTSAPYFSPPSKTQESPRSPSPVRSMLAGDSLRPDNSRSVSAPGPFKALANRKNTLSQLAVPSKPQPSAEEIRKQERERIAAQKAKQAAEEDQDLSDREDERVREELGTEVEGTKTLDPFLAHQDYIGAVDKPGMPGQIEKVYRDINSMIDTLGLNARSLTAFVKGHTELHKQSGRSREDLEDDDWCLIEIGDLNTVEDKLEQKLEAGQIQDVQKKLNECRDLRKGVAALRAKGGDFAKAVETRSDSEVAESARTAPLRLEQATQQHELRKQFMRFQKLLAETEENITMLRAKLASCETSNANGRPLKKPTVEAVTNTIKKMTSMVERKSGDIDVLETQMRHLRFSSAALSQSSREGSPFTPLPSTSPKSKQFPRSGGRSVQNGQSYTPGRSTNRPGTPRKAIQEVTPEEVQRYREKAQRRQEVNLIMKEAFSKTGPRIRALD
ncbi:hypothetical protein HO173_001616 [Letharia columbiana]|uniref:Nucleoporin Nup159/Nup146 N-terminal domain-containing protein n=1 Tax=Letharia columbiana TaxID=112416 RepID=A0A8H6G3R8_9LECA|nr:uncharacterized protein HO173_001616 [Letharia columbiana]KAF6240008.1 hypothetical protein HO173_001616 [Letharia columbiana]